MAEVELRCRGHGGGGAIAVQGPRWWRWNLGCQGGAQNAARLALTSLEREGPVVGPQGDILCVQQGDLVPYLVYKVVAANRGKGSRAAISLLGLHRMVPTVEELRIGTRGAIGGSVCGAGFQHSAKLPYGSGMRCPCQACCLGHKVF